MKSPKNLLYKATLILSLFIGTPQLSSVNNKLQLHAHENKKTTVALPFQYKHLSEEERKHLVVVPEYHCTVLKKNSKKTVVIGPLQPCKLVALKNKKTGTAIFFHVHDANNIEKMCEIAQQKIKIESPEDLTGLLFTNASQQLQGRYPSAFPGQTQKEKVKRIKDALVSYFKIKDRTQISAKIFHTKYKDFELGDYEYAELSIFFDNEFKPHSICGMHENIYKIPNLEKYTLNDRLKITHTIACLYEQDSISKKFSNAFQRYNTDGFIELS